MRLVSMLLFMIISLQAIAGGKISGTITDEKTGDPLIGATVSLKDIGKGTATDVDGNYNLLVDAGTYTVVVNYIGYQAKEIEDVVVTDNNTTNLNVLISESKSTQLEEVVVKSSLKKENINALYIMQKNSIAVSSGISADVIQRTPDRNTGEVLKRVSGASVKDNKYVVIRGLNDRYNIAMVNNALMPSTEPDKKAFSFDVIPSNVIDNIIINKTASADMPGDFAGGIVQVLTKDVPESNFINVGITTSYNTQTTFKDFTSDERSAGDYLAFPSANGLPSAFGKNYTNYASMPLDQQVAAAKKLPNSYVPVTSTALPNSSLQLSAGKAIHLKNGNKLGIIGGLSYRNGQNIVPEYTRGLYETSRVSRYSTETQNRFSSNLSGLLNMSYLVGKSKISWKSLYNKMYDNNSYEREGYSTSNNQQFKLYSTIPSERQVANSQLEGEHALGNRNIKFNWNLNYSNFTARQQDLRTAFYGRSVTFDNNDEPVSSETMPYEIIDRNSRRFFGKQTDNNFGGNASISYPFEMFGQKQTVKVGYLGLYKQRSFGMRVLQYDYRGSANGEARMLPVGVIFNQSNIATNQFTINEITNQTDKYDASALQNAAFVMFDNNLGSKWRLTWGVRYESYTQNLDGADRTQKVNKTDVFNDVLPSLSLSYSISEKTKLRLAGSRTVNRPEFREIAPFQFVDFENLWTISGNPNLKRGNINNLDFRYEYYPNPGEAITAGVFYKQFENPIEAKMDDQSNLDLLIFTYQNAKSASAVGVEAEIRKNVSFLGDAKWMENFFIGGNVSYIYSRVSNIVGVSNNIGTKTERPLQGQSPYLVNLSLLYNDVNSGWAFSALYNRIGHRIAIVGSGTIPTTWENGRDVVDLQVSKAVLKRKGELKFMVSDLLNQPTTLYWNTNNSDSYQKGNSKAGVGNDQVFQQYRLGTTFTVGFNYKIGK